MDAGREICEETTGRFYRRREDWWWNETVQQIIKEKKEAYKKGKKVVKRTIEKHTSKRGKRRKSWQKLNNLVGKNGRED